MSELEDFYELLQYTRRKKAPRRYLRDRSDPFRKYTEEEFRARYTFSPSIVKNKLLPLLASDLNPPTMRGLPFTPEIMLLITLRYYSTGSVQNLGDDVIITCQASASRIVAKVSSILAWKMKKIVKFPAMQDISRVKEKFCEIANFPDVIGCIGCTQIKIKSPGEKYSKVFRSKKGWPSINVQAVTGPNMEFYDLVARWPGSTPDSYIYNRSVLKQRLESGALQGTLLGHSGYSVSTELLTPIFSPDAKSHIQYNDSHMKTRNIGKVFATWKKTFPCLEVGMGVKIDTAIAVICATAMLCNILIKYDDFKTDDYDNISINYDDEIVPIKEDPNSEGFSVRQSIVERFFLTQAE